METGIVEEKMELNRQIEEFFSITPPVMNSYSPLPLAFLGDCVFEIVIRTIVVEKGNRQANTLHTEKSKIVNAKAQADMIEALMPDLTDEERSVYRRGKNAKGMSPAKNADIKDYRRATGLEAVMGYLYLQGKMERVLELVRLGLERIGKL